MASKLLIRAYNVGVGDCFYCRIPDATTVDGVVTDFHMLIDCGSKGSADLLEKALKHLQGELPATVDGRKRLDLIVVTHEHEDHIKGFDPVYFKKIKVGAVWMNCAMNPKHPQADKTNALKGFAFNAARQLAASGTRLGAAATDLVLGIANPGAVTALRKTLLGGGEPTYVKAGDTNAALGVPLNGATISVLAPESDIDRFYLGKSASTDFNGMAATAGGFALAPAATVPKALPQPRNIGPASFRQLRSRMQSSALAFAELASRVTNNTSAVLLIEWRGKRMLFVGDAEWHGKFKEGSKSNGSWNVMWNQRNGLLNKPVDFLKIGHHGSENSTPWQETDGAQTETGAILDAILPKPRQGEAPTAVAVVSTARINYKTIPRGKLMTLIGQRVANAKLYGPSLKAKRYEPGNPDVYAELEAPFLGEPQPMRTDFETFLTGKDFVDIEFG